MINLVKFWMKIISNKNTLLFKIYSIMRNDADSECHYSNLSWVYNVKQLIRI
jgi:hypothetical protein